MSTASSLIYLDHAAATPVRAEVVRAMAPYWSDQFANPSSITAVGRQAKVAVQTARATVARLLGAHPDEIIFTASGTESANLAIVGLMRAAPVGAHAIITASEHHAVLEPASRLTEQGYRLSIVPVDETGTVDQERLAAAIVPETRLISTIYANNEIGTIAPMADLARLIRRLNRQRKDHQRSPILWHTDACQAAGYLSVDVASLGVDALTLNAAKVGGPKGSGALYLRRGLTLVPQLSGGHQELGRRAGTENVPAIVGLAAALERAQVAAEAETSRLAALRNQLEAALTKNIPSLLVNGHPERRLPNHLNVTLPGIDAEAAVLYLDRDGVAVGTGAACSNTSLEPSHVLLAIGRTPDQALSSLRITLGHTTTAAEIERASQVIVTRLRWLRTHLK